MGLCVETPEAAASLLCASRGGVEALESPESGDVFFTCAVGEFADDICESGADAIAGGAAVAGIVGPDSVTVFMFSEVGWR